MAKERSGYSGIDSKCCQLGIPTRFEHRQNEKSEHWCSLFKNYKAHYACVVKKKMTKSEFLNWSDLTVEFRDVAITGKIGIDECEEKIKANVIKSILLLKKRAKINIMWKRL